MNHDEAAEIMGAEMADTMANAYTEQVAARLTHPVTFRRENGQYIIRQRNWMVGRIVKQHNKWRIDVMGQHGLKPTALAWSLRDAKTYYIENIAK